MGRTPSFFFFNDTATTEIYTLSLHDALPISHREVRGRGRAHRDGVAGPGDARRHGDRKSTRLNSSHSQISYAVFCLKKKNTPTPPRSTTKVPRISQPDSTSRSYSLHRHRTIT